MMKSQGMYKPVLSNKNVTEGLRDQLNPTSDYIRGT